jgi:hypothetical protein
MTGGELLRGKIDLAYPRLAAATARLWSGPGLRPRYLDYLGTMYQVVRSAVPLMEFTLAVCEELGPADRVAGAVAGYLRRHIAEEAGHDEWVLEDLEAASGDRAGARRRIPPPRVAAAFGAQYHWVRHGHPAALLGHMAVMEGYPPSAELVERLEAATGYPPAAFRSLRRHARLDVGHRADLHRLLDEVPLSAAQHELAGISALYTVGAVAGLFEELSAPPVPVP